MYIYAEEEVNHTDWKSALMYKIARQFFYFCWYHLCTAPLQGPCWFCLGGAEVEKHLVVSVADNVSVIINVTVV